ncbi:sensor histidine kinase [Serratia odorifera]|jgi:two-component system, OmpR family, sensor histidine kinase TctE|uniref:histidine kinase n=2 Tax=Serratia odorifera TaxID=618 RepID=D4E3K1_SEROD|nr:sensor histidine kinase [Serratia odorifera]EFE95549.1 ATPase/histidine kinase/DNA gyrase B/HSP90 domain protein [Serratia odorifera DSM 4582]MBJ2066017.1 sensor histidine kinase N-terminal domain-containing protein [Serratia odorifera]PNK90286.1 sensor histidine kinase [Serratia odorifera]RII71274.1 sensor histidine kinase [Serratia odorifera]VDZ60193.1 Sensor protein qseC [Serratia odorifera]
MKWFNPPRSLFNQLLLFFGLPLMVLGGISIYTHYFSAMSAATLAYDRTLLASARTVAERLIVRGGRLEVDVPYVVLDSFERNMNDQLYYEVISPEGISISGYDDLPLPPKNIPRSNLYPALVHFYDASYYGRPIRVAALYQPINESGVMGMAVILVAETLESRKYLARQMMLAALASQGTVVVLTLLLAFVLLKKLLKPLRKLSSLMMRRDPGELTPLPMVLPWSEMQPLLLAFNRYIERLRVMVARQERFSADASHQLRTPLAVLKTQVGVALASDRPEQWRESLLAMSTTLDNTVALTDRLLHLSRLKAHEHSAERRLQPVDLAQLLRDACFSRLPQARSKQIDLGYEGLAACWINGEALLLTEMCANLLDNALKYTPRNGVVTARVLCDQGAGDCLLEIEDSGPGIAQEDALQALLPFHRLDNVGSQPGAGLGLALVKDILAYHGTRPQLLPSSELGGLLVRVRFTPSPG